MPQLMSAPDHDAAALVLAHLKGKLSEVYKAKAPWANVPIVNQILPTSIEQRANELGDMSQTGREKMLFALMGANSAPKNALIMAMKAKLAAQAAPKAASKSESFLKNLFNKERQQALEGGRPLNISKLGEFDQPEMVGDKIRIWRATSKDGITPNSFVTMTKNKAQQYIDGSDVGSKNRSVQSLLVDPSDITEHGGQFLYTPRAAEKAAASAKTIKPPYGMSHRPTFEGMPPSHNLLEGETLPRDVYTHPDYSISSGRIRGGDKAANESWNALQKIKGKPDSEITIYRASPKNELNSGDWITFSKEYAQQSVEGTEKVHSFKVKAKDIVFAGDDINEFGYYPQGKAGKI